MTEIQQQKNIKIIFKIFSFFVQTFFDLDYHWPLEREARFTKRKMQFKMWKNLSRVQKKLKIA